MKTLAAFIIALLAWGALMVGDIIKAEQTIIYRYCGKQVPQVCRDVVEEVK